MIRILFLAANPVGTTRLKLDEEYKDIEGQLRKTRYRDQFDLRLEPAVKVTELQEVLQIFDANIAHFSGHGSEDHALILEGPDGPREVPPAALANLFRILNDGRSIRCVVLNACYSEEQAEAIAKHVDCVIGMSSAVTDEAARSFAAQFYQGLGFGDNIRKAFERGCNQLELLNIPEESIPRLHSRPGVDPAKISLLSKDEGGNLNQPLRREPSAGHSDVSSRGATDDISRGVNQKDSGQQWEEEFQPVGNWRVQVYDALGSQIYVELAVNGAFQGMQQTPMGSFPFAGMWSYDPMRKLLQLQGVSNGINPFILGIFIRGKQGNGFSGTGTDNYAYFFTRA